MGNKEIVDRTRDKERQNGEIVFRIKKKLKRNKIIVCSNPQLV